MHEAVLSIGLDEEDTILAAARQCAGTLAGLEWSLTGTGASDVSAQDVRNAFWMLAEALLGYQDRHNSMPAILTHVRDILRPWLFLVGKSLDADESRWFVDVLSA